MSDEIKTLGVNAARELKGDIFFNVRVTETEAAALGRCLTAYFNRLTAEKKTLPPELAMPVFQVMHRLKDVVDKGGGIYSVQ